MAAACSSSCPSTYTGGAVPGCQLPGAAGEGPPGHGVQILLDLIRGQAGQFRQVPRAQATTGGGDQAQQVLLGLVTVQQPLELALHVSPDHGSRARRGQHSHDGRIAQRMIIRDIRRDRRIRPPGHDDPQPSRRPGRQQRGDAVGIRAGRHAAVLIQAIDDQHQPLV